MNRILITFLVSSFLVIAYTVSVGVGSAFYVEDSYPLFERLMVPLTAPFVVAKFLFPDFETESLVLPIFLGLIGNGLLYAIPVYSILSLLHAFGKSKNISQGDPPPPPSFQ